MLNFVPNVVILNYLKHTNQSTPKLEAKTKRYLESGYQQELTFQRYDGSFSAFGRNDASGSVWLTAFVAKSFRQASTYIDIDDVIIENALKWLSENQVYTHTHTYHILIFFLYNILKFINIGNKR